MIDAIGNNFPEPSVTIRKKPDGKGGFKEYISSISFLGKAEPPAVEGLPPPPSTVVEAAVFQKQVDGETGGETLAYTVMLTDQVEQEDLSQFNEQEETTMETPDVAAQLNEAREVIAELKETAKAHQETALEFSKMSADDKAESAKLRESVDALKGELVKSRQEKVENDIATFAQGLTKEHGLAKNHADRITELCLAVSAGNDKMTFSGESEEKPLIEQVKMVFSQLAADGVKAYVPKGEEAGGGDAIPPTAGGKPPETEGEWKAEFSRIGKGIPEDDLAAIMDDPKLTNDKKKHMIELAKSGISVSEEGGA